MQLKGSCLSLVIVNLMVLRCNIDVNREDNGRDVDMFNLI